MEAHVKKKGQKREDTQGRERDGENFNIQQEIRKTF